MITRSSHAAGDAAQRRPRLRSRESRGPGGQDATNEQVVAWEAVPGHAQAYQQRSGLGQGLLRPGLKGTPASFPLPGTRGCEGKRAQQAGEGLLGLAVAEGAGALGLIRGCVHPLGSTPDADPDAGLRSVDAAAVAAAPDDRSLRGRERISRAAARWGEAAQRGTRGLLNRLVCGLPLALGRLCAG